MKHFTLFLTIAILSSCSGGSSSPKPYDYLETNISKWNTSINHMDELYKLVETVNTVGDYAKLKQRTEWLLNSLNNRMDGLTTEGSGVPDDVKVMNTALMDYLKTSKEMVLVYDKLANHAVEMSDEELDAEHAKIDSLATASDSIAGIASNLQDEYAKAHNLELETKPSKTK